MKKLLLQVTLTVALGFCFGRLEAQSISDDLTQLTLDIEKLSELKSVLSDMKEGYTIISQGYETVKEIAQGNFDLHQAFLDALWVVSPAVRNYKKITLIINDQLTLVSEYQGQYKTFSGSGHFSSAELGYIMGVYNNLILQSVNNLNELITVVSDNQVRMSDAERISAIDRLYRDMQGKLVFLKSFDDGAALLSLQRAHGQGQVQETQKLYGIQGN